jgi:aryl-alcohol dehydrogenase-like predicted oxidoreductase
MEWRRCGRSDLELPLLGVGAWSFGGGPDDYWGPQSEQDADAVVSRAIELDCRYFDTAEGYNNGASERALGRLLKGRRDKVLIGTKVSPHNCEPSTLREHCEASLENLQTDYVDLYMIHWPLPSDLVEPAFATLEELRAEGKVRHHGISNFGVEQMTEVLATGSRPVVNQLGYSLLMRAIELEIVPFCQQRGIGIMAYMPLMQGILTGKYDSPDEVPKERARSRHFSGTRENVRHGEEGAEAETFTALREIRALAMEADVSIANMALAWCATNHVVSCVLAGARNVGQLESNARGVSKKLSPEVLIRLDEITHELKLKLGPNPDMWQGARGSRIR